MRIFKRTFFVLLILLLAFAAYTVWSTGFFRSIENYFHGEIVKEIFIPGAEDITIDAVDSFAIISSTDRGEFPPLEEEEGDLYLMDLKQKDFEVVNLTSPFPTAFAPHGISMIKTDSTHKILAINHTLAGHSIEVFRLHNSNLIHEKTLTDPSMISPNDLVMIDEHRFYFTNDHGYTKGLGRFIEEYGGLAASNVIYYDGENFREVDKRIAYANGINFDPARNLLFVSSPRDFLVKVYNREEDGSLSFIENIPCGSGVDNIEFDEQGNLWIGSHPNLLRFAAYATGKKATSPSEILKISYRGLQDYTVEKIYMDDGETMSASSVAAPFGDLILAGNVKDDAFLVLKR